MRAPVALAPGMCSVTMRHLSIDEVVDEAVRCQLAGIEWGGDVHVPAGDTTAARHARHATADAGLRVASYGSYLFADAESAHGATATFDTAEELGARLVRIWCPLGVEPGCAVDVRVEVIEVLRELAAAAAPRNLTLYLEFHGHTLTSTSRSTLELLSELDCDNVATAWQPAYWDSVREEDPAGSAIDDISTLSPWLAHLHIYEWGCNLQRRPLSRGELRWRAALDAARGGRTDLDRFALLEFVEGDNLESLRADAATLRSWLATDV